MEVSDAKKLKALEAENAKLKKTGRKNDGGFDAQGDVGKKLLRAGSRRTAL